MNMRWLVVVAMLLGGGFAWADDSVFGFTLGKPLDLQRCPPTSEWGLDRPTCWTGTGQDEDVLEKRGSVIVFWGMGDRPSIYGDYRFSIYDGLLDGVEIKTRGYEDQQYILLQLKRKYGEPSFHAEELRRNAYGREYAAVLARWENSKVSVNFYGFIKDPSWGMLEISTQAKESRKKAAREAASKTVRDL